MRETMVVVLFGFAVVKTASGVALAKDEPISQADRTFFENKIRPVLVKHCVRVPFR
jgi:hypothetical protein